MIGMTEREKRLAIANGSPGTGGSIILAEVSTYFDTHENGRPDIDAVLNIKVKGDSNAERIARVSEIARWLGVGVEFRNETYFAQRRWIAPDGESLTIEAHFTPDHDAAFAAMQQAAGRGAAA